MYGGLIVAYLRRQAPDLGSGKPADRLVADAVEPERVPELRSEPRTVIGEPGAQCHIARDKERLLGRHQPVMPPGKQARVNIDAEDSRTLSVHPRIVLPRASERAPGIPAAAELIRVAVA